MSSAAKSSKTAAPKSPAWPADEFRAAVEHAKLEAMKELAYGASHEINNPLANIAARAQSLLKRESDEEKRRMLEAIHRQAMRAHEMISDLMLFARPPKLVKEPVAIVGLLNKVANELRPLATERSIEITVGDENSGASVDGDPVQLSVAVKALLENSIDAIGKDGQIAVGTAISGDNICIEVRDTGPGISPEASEHLFDPFFSGREAGRGLGFGLSKCWRIVTNHGGDVTASSSPVAGATFRITLPRG